MDTDGQFSSINIKVSQAESKKALALYAHLRRLFETAVYGGNIQRPILMDQADLLLCSASLRALFLDNKPILPKFDEQHSLNFKIECFETNINMLLLSHLVPDEIHVSDFFLDALINPEKRADFPLNQSKECLYTFQDGSGFESVRDRTGKWVPSWVPDYTTDDVGIASNGAPLQMLKLTRRECNLWEWGSITLGYLKNIPIRRKTIINYVANQLGGVHYDAQRFPKDPDDHNEFKALTEAFDWDNQAIMHAGLVAVALATVEVVTMPSFLNFLNALDEFHNIRQKRLELGEDLKPRESE